MDTMVTGTGLAAIRACAERRFVHLELTGERMFGFPADRFRVLRHASDDQLKKVRVEVDGHALTREELDEDLSVTGIVAGRFQLPLPRRASPAARGGFLTTAQTTSGNDRSRSAQRLSTSGRR
jgi:hypothetical protein